MHFCLFVFVWVVDVNIMLVEETCLRGTAHALKGEGHSFTHIFMKIQYLENASSVFPLISLVGSRSLQRDVAPFMVYLDGVVVRST